MRKEVVVAAAVAAAALQTIEIGTVENVSLLAAAAAKVDKAAAAAKVVKVAMAEDRRLDCIYTETQRQPLRIY